MSPIIIGEHNSPAAEQIIGANLARARGSLTHDAAAQYVTDATGISFTAQLIADIEAGTTTTTIQELLALSWVYNVTPADMLNPPTTCADQSCNRYAVGNLVIRT